MSAAPDVRLIAALDRRFGIGKAGGLPWHLPLDLKRFKALTLGHAVLMGRKTAESIGRALPGRRNLVWTRQRRAPFAEQIVVADLSSALAQSYGPLFVIGGGEVYAQTLPLATHLHLTWVETEVPEADTFFPSFDRRNWTLVSEQAHPADAKHAVPFCFADYMRSASSELT